MPSPHISGQESISVLRGTLAAAGVEEITLSGDALATYLDRALRGELEVEELCELAELLEGHDAIRYEKELRSRIADTLFELASPEINGIPNQNSIQLLRKKLQQSLAG